MQGTQRLSEEDLLRIVGDQQGLGDLSVYRARGRRYNTIGKGMMFGGLAISIGGLLIPQKHGELGIGVFFIGMGVGMMGWGLAYKGAQRSDPDTHAVERT